MDKSTLDIQKIKRCKSNCHGLAISPACGDF
ncbi:hypothetical protein LVISKB_1884 [Levilactobacillus brevis KB290]|uniref:Uncharacterized protein n=1 Tax=Levilactobacillus brevis KB290 TaxID=1001583 RepID=M5AFC5_LEVBR|nr:hypothetical protein LVISKB_1884 [Levilactobacillus brevis KB290]